MYFFNNCVILQTKTGGFVDKLFSALESKEYLEFKPPSPAKETKPTDGAEASGGNDAAAAAPVKDENDAPPAENAAPADKSGHEAAKHGEGERRDSGGRR